MAKEVTHRVVVRRRNGDLVREQTIAPGQSHDDAKAALAKYLYAKGVQGEMLYEVEEVAEDDPVHS